jgi:hypothetical protein
MANHRTLPFYLYLLEALEIFSDYRYLSGILVDKKTLATLSTSSGHKAKLAGQQDR